MPDWPVVITGTTGSLTLDPNPVQVQARDLVFWPNETNDSHTITVPATGTDPAWSSGPVAPWTSSNGFAIPVDWTTSGKEYPYQVDGKQAGTFKVVALVLALLLAFAASPRAQAQGGQRRASAQPPQGSFPCPAPTGLQPIPEIASNGTGKLAGTIVTVGRNVALPFRTGPTANICYNQWVRAYVVPGNLPTNNNPLPGPTLRAHVGDLVELTFINQIDPLNFPGTDTGNCDQTSLYPAGPNVTVPDSMPNCFHGSTMTNIHYHGTHTSPSSTADNVFVEILPSPRAANQSRTPAVTPASVQAAFTEFFGACEQHLQPNTPLVQWPVVWSDATPMWQKMQAQLIASSPAYKPLDDTNQAQIKQGAWPQYYIGAYPYCFRLPAYTGNTWPPAPPASLHALHSAEGGGPHAQSQQAALPLVMGQSPGTHWYHAHKHGSTTINVSNGMTGVFIIEGKYDDDINAWYSPGVPTSNPKSFTRKAPVLVINQLGATPSLERGGAGGPGASFSVNGALQPILPMAPGEVQMWRIANSSARGGVYFLPPAGLQWKQLAQDGVQFTQTNYDASLNQPILVEAGSRIDLLVKAPASGQIPVIVYVTVDPSDRNPNRLSPPSPPAAPTPGAPVQRTLLTVNVTTAAAVTGNAAQFMPVAPPQPPFLTDITDKEIRATRLLEFSSVLPDAPTTPPTPGLPPNQPTQHMIDGHKFSGEVGALVLLNQAEEWKIVNATYSNLNTAGVSQISHPFHIHINPFQVVEIFDPNDVLTDGKTPLYVFDKSTMNPATQCYLDPQDPASWHPCANTPRPTNAWRDVFSIPSGRIAYNTANPPQPILDKDGKQIHIPGYFKMRSRFVDYTGYYVLHCHILAHEDRGMMTVVQVSPLATPYEHH